MKDLIDSLFPVMSKAEQKEMLRQVTDWANADSLRESIEDPLAKIPRA